MSIRDEGRAFRIDDVPGLHWALVALFVGVGSLFTLGPLGLFTDAEKLRWPLRVLICLLWLTAVPVGLWVFAGAPLSRLVVDRAVGKIRLERWGLSGHSTFEWPCGAPYGSWKAGMTRVERSSRST